VKKGKVSIHKKTHKRSRISRVKEELFFGLEGSFIVIFGGGFLVIVVGLMILHI
jgi:hypothetical protein